MKNNDHYSFDYIELIAEKDPILRSMQNVAIAVFLILEKYSKSSKESFWSPYIESLPSSYDTILYFTKDEMELLKFSPSAFRKFTFHIILMKKN